jgi:glycosyltransferase involved in cell wall biosynthesis
MSVFNGERFVAEAIESILNQTFRDFEFIIIDDGSTDGTAAVLRHYQEIDLRIVVHHQQNKGLIASLNAGCDLAQGRYIARMDADDVAIPERLDRQINYLEQFPAIALLGSSVNIIDDRGRHLYFLKFPTADEKIKEWLYDLHQVPISHPTVVFRTEVLRATGGYRPALLAGEDYDLFIRIAERWQVANLEEPVLNMRRHANSVSIMNIRQQVISILGAWAAANIRRAGGHDPTDSGEVVSLDLLKSMGVSDAVFEETLMGVYLHWIDVLLKASDKAGALGVMREALESQSWKHINKSIIANTWLAAARVYCQQGRYLQSLNAGARALAIRPIIAGRPLKRIASRLGLVNRNNRPTVVAPH